MTINLTADLERRIHERIERGDYADVDDFLREAVERLLEEEEADLEDLRARLRNAEAEIDRGEGIELDEHTTAAFARDIHERGLKRLATLGKTGTEG